MDRKQWRWIMMGGALGSAALAGAILLRRQRAKRGAIPQYVNEAIQDTLRELNAGSMFVEVNGLQLHTVVAGPSTGPLVIMLHGFPESWYSWRKQIPALAKAGYRVVALDQRGYNLSDKPAGVANYHIDRLVSDVRQVMDYYGYNRAVIVGHDWGGAVAWRFAMQFPEATQQLIVMNAPHPSAFVRELRAGWAQRLRSWYIGFFQIPWLPETLLGLSPTFTTRLFFRDTATRQDAFSDEDLRVMETALYQPGALQAEVNWYRAAARYGLALHSRTIQAPTLLIWGEDDVALDLALTYGLEQWVPNLTVYRIPNCGHWVQNEAPEEVNERMLAFLQAHPQTPLTADLPEAAQMVVDLAPAGRSLEPHVEPENEPVTSSPQPTEPAIAESPPPEEELPDESRVEPRSD